MRTLIISEGQTIYDVMAQEYGSLENTLEFLQLNGFTYNTVLRSGQLVQLAEKPTNESIVNLYKSKHHELNSHDPRNEGDYHSRDHNNRDYKAV